MRKLHSPLLWLKQIGLILFLSFKLNINMRMPIRVKLPFGSQSDPSRNVGGMLIRNCSMKIEIFHNE